MRLLAFFVVLVVCLSGCISIAPATPAQFSPAPSSTETTTLKGPPPSPTLAEPTPSLSAPTSEPSAQSGPSGTPSSSTGPSSSTAPSATPGQRPKFSTVQDAYNQTVTWHSCTIEATAGMCGTVYVPTVYEQPNAGTTALAVARFPATGAGTALGDMFLNPGGPGAPGIAFAADVARIAPDLSSTYNFVGFDPRGTGQSDPLVCLDTKDLDTLNAFDPTPDDAQERQEGIDLIDAQGQACEQNSGLLASHVSTVEAARDMDVMRAVLGDDKMTYFGFSYGTFLGTTYAALFPDKVDRFVLDGALAPGLSTMQVAEVQTQGLQTELDAYVQNCITTDQFCPLGTSASAGEQKIRDLLVSVDSTPLQTGDSARPLTQQLAFWGIISAMYTPVTWPTLTTALGAALQGNGQLLLGMSDSYFDRTKNGYADNLAQANQDINCLDEEIAGGPTTADESTFVKESPIAGDIMYGLADRGCGDWPPKTTLTAPNYHAPGTPPIVVIGTTRDPATPLVWAQDLAKTLANGVLLTRDGDGHTAYLSGNPCIVSNVDTFFVQGTVPAAGTVC